MKYLEQIEQYFDALEKQFDDLKTNYNQVSIDQRDFLFSRQIEKNEALSEIKNKIEELKNKNKQAQETIDFLQKSIDTLQRKMLVAVRPDLECNIDFAGRDDILYSSIFSLIQMCQNIEPITWFDRFVKNQAYTDFSFKKNLLKILESIDEEFNKKRVECANSIVQQQNYIKTNMFQIDSLVSEYLKLEKDSSTSFLVGDDEKIMHSMNQKAEELKVEIGRVNILLEQREKILAKYLDMHHILDNSPNIIEALLSSVEVNHCI